MRLRTITIIFALMLLVPFFASAKSPEIKGYAHSRGKAVSVEQSSGWPVAVSSKGYIDVGIESLPGMTVVKAKGYKPWWQFWGTLEATTTISVGGLPKDTKLHIYTNGYREHAEVMTGNSGLLQLDVPTREGKQFIIKARPSTYHINLNGNIWNLFAKGGDCKDIGTWSTSTKTCTLTTDVNRDGNRTIAIEDNGITLDGNNHKVIGVGSDDGVYTDMSNVVIKNLDVSGFARGIVYVASHGLIFSPPTGGTIQSVTLANLAQNIHIEGMSGIAVNGATSIGADTGLFITDLNLDGYPTYGIEVSGSTIKGASLGAYTDNIDPITITRNNWQDNGTDISQVNSGIVLADITTRGNFWSKNTDCIQNSVNPNECTNRYDVPGISTDDTLPWACKNAWLASVNCSPGGGGGGGGEALSLLPPVEFGEFECNYPSYPGHQGIDFVRTDKNIYGDNILASQKGTVHSVNPSGAGLGGAMSDAGVNMWVMHGQVKKLNEVVVSNVSTRYLHMSEVKNSPSPGDNINARQIIGLVGNTGKILPTPSSNQPLAGAHLHFEVRSGTSTNYLKTAHLDPRDFFNLKKAPINGYCILVESPVYLVITDQTGATIPTLQYSTHFDDGITDKYENEVYVVKNVDPGPYNIKVVPKETASPNDAFSVTIFSYGVPLRLANNIKISNAPPDPYLVNLDSIGSVTSGGAGGAENKATICHIPPGNPAKTHTITVGQAAIPAHLGHGDTLGACPTSSGGTAKVPSGHNKRTTR